MTVEVEVIVDRSVCGGELLQGLDVPEARHGSFSSFEDLCRNFMKGPGHPLPSIWRVAGSLIDLHWLWRFLPNSGSPKNCQDDDNGYQGNTGPEHGLFVLRRHFETLHVAMPTYLGVPD